jgi:hypothetical protein
MNERFQCRSISCYDGTFHTVALVILSKDINAGGPVVLLKVYVASSSGTGYPDQRFSFHSIVYY